MTTDEQFREIRDELRRNADRTAGLAATVDVLREDAPKYAPQATVDKLAEVQRQHGERIAAHDAIMTDRDSALDKVLGFMERLTGRPGFRFTLLVGLLLASMVLLYACSDRLLDIGDAIVNAERRQAAATEDLVDEAAEPLTPAKDTVATVP